MGESRCLKDVKYLALLIAGLLVFAAGCKSQKKSSEKDEAEAVEANEQAAEDDKSAEKGEEESGAAAEEKEKAKKSDESGGSAPKKAKIGEPAPGFTLTDAKGNEHSLSDYEGKIVVLEWFSTECPYVKRHYKAETMSKTLEKLGGSEKVAWLAVDSSHFAKPKASKKWREKYGFDYPVLHDEKGKVGKKYGAKTTPHMYVIDKKGVLRYKGAIDDDPMGDKEPSKRTNYVEQAVDALQNGKEVDPRTTEAYGCSVKYEG